ncbi:hypothetical protein NQZ68_039034 [Dissostichus eleginoides]|nr:hypothetical protein NQZ68_039034 [Dissostichus eleginoides]
MEESVLLDLLECPVCLERLDATAKVLPCQHTFCRRCLQSILGSRGELRCPECRTLVESGVDELPSNILLVRLLDGIKQRPRGGASAARGGGQSTQQGSNPLERGGEPEHSAGGPTTAEERHQEPPRTGAFTIQSCRLSQSEQRNVEALIVCRLAAQVEDLRPPPRYCSLFRAEFPSVSQIETWTLETTL